MASIRGSRASADAAHGAHSRTALAGPASTSSGTPDGAESRTTGRQTLPLLPMTHVPHASHR
jgi:hypothetical protein